jgi:O-antigen ligase
VGVGLGNSARAYEEVIIQSDSDLGFQKTGSAHNQYLNYLIRFGILGAMYILGILTYLFIKGRKNHPLLLTIFFASMLVANFGEANWETFIGLNFFAFFICFLMWLAPKDIFTE